MTANTKKIAIIAAAAVAAIGIGIFAFLRPASDDRKDDPEKYISLALHNTYELLNIPEYDSDWIYDILGGKHELDIGLAFKDIDLGSRSLLIDGQILSIAQLASLDIGLVRDPAAEKLTADLSLAAGGAALLSTELYLSDGEMAVKAPQGFDYFITADPRRIVDEWNGSDLGAVMPISGVTSNDAFYSFYKKLFVIAEKPEKLKVLNDTLTLYKEAEYGYIEEVDGLYSYSLRITRDNFNSWYSSMVGSLEKYELFKQMGIDVAQLYNFSVTGDLDVILHVKDDVMISAQITTLLQNDVTLKAVADLRGEANPFDDVFVKIDMGNPNSDVAIQSEYFSAANAVNPYLMIDEMPQNVSIEINHRGDSQKPELFLSEADITMSAGEDRTEIAWEYLWDLSGDVLDNFKFNARLSQYASEGTAEIGFNVSGSAIENREKLEFLSSFSDISYYLTDFDENEQSLALTLKLNMKSAPDAVINYDKTGATALIDLSPIQLMRIYANLKSDPILGGLIE